MANDGGDGGDLDKSSWNTESGNSGPHDESWSIRSECGPDGLIRRGKVDTVDEQHRPLHYIFDSCMSCGQRNLDIFQGANGLRRNIAFTDE